jgi:hypothetical protein
MFISCLHHLTNHQFLGLHPVVNVISVHHVLSYVYLGNFYHLVLNCGAPNSQVINVSKVPFIIVATFTNVSTVTSFVCYILNPCVLRYRFEFNCIIDDLSMC